MRRAAIVIMFIAALLMLGGMCSNQSNKKKDSGTNTPSGSCDNNTAPALTAIGFSVGGAATEGDTTAPLNESIQLLLGYEDGDLCNLAGGSILVSVNGEDPSESPITGEIDCPHPAVEGSPIASSIVPTTTGDLTVEASVVDLCGAQSNTLSATLTVTEAVDDDTAADDTADDDTTDDDTAAAILEGEMIYTGGVSATGIYVLLYTHWLPTELPVFMGPVTVPETGFPFPYQLELTGVGAGDYYVSAYLDADPEDGLYKPELDPTHSPWLAVTVTPGETTEYDITLVDP